MMLPLAWKLCHTTS